jgi:hypothetical protein
VNTEGEVAVGVTEGATAEASSPVPGTLLYEF